MRRQTKMIAVLLCCALLLSSASYAASYVKTIQAHYSGIKLVVDGVPVPYRTVNGETIEPFIYNGTTYLPVRDIGEALGKQVTWDGNTHTVYIGKVPGKETYLLDVCPPYEKRYYSAPATFNMMGKAYANGFTLGASNIAYALFNLNAEYSTIEFDFGHIDGSSMWDITYYIYLDGKLAQTISGTSEMTVTHVTVPLRNALQAKIIGASSGYTGAAYGFANATLK